MSSKLNMNVHKSTSVYELTSKLLRNVPTGRYLLNQTSPPRHVKCSSTDGSTFSAALSRHGTELDTSGRLSLCASLRGHFSAAAVALHFSGIWGARCNPGLHRFLSLIALQGRRSRRPRGHQTRPHAVSETAIRAPSSPGRPLLEFTNLF